MLSCICDSMPYSFLAGASGILCGQAGHRQTGFGRIESALPQTGLQTAPRSGPMLGRNLSAPVPGWTPP